VKRANRWSFKADDGRIRCVLFSDDERAWLERWVLEQPKYVTLASLARHASDELELAGIIPGADRVRDYMLVAAGEPGMLAYRAVLARCSSPT